MKLGLKGLQTNIDLGIIGATTLIGFKLGLKVYLINWNASLEDQTGGMSTMAVKDTLIYSLINILLFIHCIPSSVI